jgi:hypothetical protein
MIGNMTFHFALCEIAGSAGEGALVWLGRWAKTCDLEIMATPI